MLKIGDRKCGVKVSFQETRVDDAILRERWLLIL